MTFSPKVWGDASRRLQEDIPDFVFDAWIAPLAVKIAEDRLVLGCPTSFHRERVRLHYAEPIRQCWSAACEDLRPVDDTNDKAKESRAWTIELVTMEDFAATHGQRVEQTAAHRPARVNLEARAAQAAGDARSALSLASGAGSGAWDTADLAATGRGPAASASPCLSAREPRSANPTDSAAGAGPVAAGRQAPPTAGLHAVPRSEKARRMRAPATPMRADRGATGARDLALPEAEPVQPELPFSFESFVVGPCNALAREATLALARARQRTLNMLYLGGESGMGKTHLARAAAIEARRHARPHSPFDTRPDGQRLDHLSGHAGLGPRADVARGASGSGVVYTTAEQFTSEFVSAMRNGRSEDWKRRYRGPIGLLIVEDVQHLSGRAKTQLELFHTVQHVLDAGGRVLLTGDCTPHDLTGLDARMRDQVRRGFVAELEPPDALVRRHILRAKAAAGGVRLPADCLDLLVESTAGSVRDIESVLIQVVTTSSLLGRPIDLELAREAIDLKSGAGTVRPPRRMEVAEIVRIVAAFFGKRPEALASRSRRRDVLVPRQLAMYLAHRYTEASLGEIGRGLGRDHPSVRNAITRVERQVLENAPMRYQVEALSERIDQRLERGQNPGSSDLHAQPGPAAETHDRD